MTHITVYRQAVDDGYDFAAEYDEFYRAALKTAQKADALPDWKKPEIPPRNEETNK